jgi:hypothetical protein
MSHTQSSNWQDDRRTAQVLTVRGAALQGRPKTLHNRRNQPFDSGFSLRLWIRPANSLRAAIGSLIAATDPVFFSLRRASSLLAAIRVLANCKDFVMV